MKQPFTIFILIVFSCNQRINSDNTTKSKTTFKDTTEQKLIKFQSQISDSIKRFEVDKYPISKEQITFFKQSKIDCKISSNNIHSYDQAWFLNDSNKEVLILSIYTDGFISSYLHLNQQLIPDNLYSYIGLNYDNGEFASLQQKKLALNGLIKQACPIASWYFKSKKGIQLGNTKLDVLNIYGEPDTTYFDNGIEILKWKFMGDQSLHSAIISNKRIALNSYGYDAIMYFKHSKLIGEVLINEIP